MSQTMRGLWLEEGQLLWREDLPPPAPSPGEAVMDLRLAGICGTDLAMTRGYADYTGIPGHEFVGQVAAAPDDPSLVGARVVGEINAACGQCATCRAGRPGHCPHRTVLGIAGRAGAFAEQLSLPLVNLHRVSDGVPDEVAVFCEPLAAALQILEQVHLHPTDRVVLVGAGRLGQLVARVLALAGCELQVVARHPRQRELLAEAGIATLAADRVPDGRADLVVEASGSPSGFALARRAVRPRGTIVLKSTYPEQLSLDISSLVVDEISLVPSRCGPFAPALRLLTAGTVDVRPLIAARYPMAEGPRALQHAGRPDTLKVLLEP